MLNFRQVGKRFGPVTTLADVSLDVKEGEFFSLLGPSGCGKTTLLRIGAGFESADFGTVAIDGVDVTKTPPHLRCCNLVFQRYALFPHLDVRANVAFGLVVKGVPKAEVATRVEEALALVSLEGYGPRGIETLSGGQQQRVAIARAIVNRPKVLLLDEPLSALDLKLRQRMQVELLALQRRLGMTFVFVTHAQDEALTLSDRVAVMNHGVIEQVGTPREVYDRPVTPFVAGFIGSMNRLSGGLASEAGGRGVVQAGGVTLGGFWAGAAVGKASAAAAGRPPVVVMVRPERVRLGAAQATDPRDGENVLAAVVERSLFKGAGYEVIARVEGALPFTVSLPPSDGSGGSGGGTSAPEPGEAVTLRFAEADTLIMAGDARQ